MSRAAGGLFDAERRLWQSLKNTGIGISAFSLTDEFSALDASAWLPIVPESFPAGWPRALGRSIPLRSRLLAEPADLLYRAGLWSWPSRNAHEWCRQYDKPEIIAPHGMLDPWAVKNSAWKKKLALLFYEQEHLRNAACLRALCESEARAIRAFGLKNPICIVPNGIDVPEIGKHPPTQSYGATGRSEIGNPPWAGNVESGRKVLLYLGRIHPKKGLANLLRAWSVVSSPVVRSHKPADWVLALAGWDQGGHEAELKRLCDELGISFIDIRTPSSELRPPTSVLFLGPQFNEAKAACYHYCDAFILPSFSEGLPMTILEAWAYAKPVVMTPECNLPEGFSAHAGIRITPDVEGIAQGLTELFGLSALELNELGRNGLRLAEAKFSWPTIAGQLRAVCEWLVGGASRPDCVCVD